MLRIYPIRTTKNQWNIYFYCKHKCTTKCEYIIMSDSTELVLENNPDFKDGICSKNLKIEKSQVRISSFDKDNPECCMGPLINSEEEVISDSSFTVSLYYPFSFIFDIFISSSEGFTLKELINAIKVLYKFIYDEEERTATPQTFSLKKVCSSCGIKNLSDYVENETNNSTNDETCSICYEKFNDLEAVKLKCDHIFHKECIEKWVEKSGTCPLCRYNIFLCDSCSGKGVIYYQYNGVVVPLEQRGSILNRNRSNGLFGIHSYDFEDLVLKSMHYDNKNKKLFVEISG
jgi:hypothetical protein